MRVLVTGSRQWNNVSLLEETLRKLMKGAGSDIVLVHGGAKGADSFASKLCTFEGWDEEIWIPDWEKHGKAAGPLRNKAMVASGVDVCIAFVVEGASRGTESCVKFAKEANVPVHIVKPDGSVEFFESQQKLS